MNAIEADRFARENFRFTLAIVNQLLGSNLSGRILMRQDPDCVVMLADDAIVRALSTFDETRGVPNRAWLTQQARWITLSWLSRVHLRNAQNTRRLYEQPDWQEMFAHLPMNETDETDRVEYLIEGLSTRTQRILRMASDGHTFKEVGEAVGLTPTRAWTVAHEAGPAVRKRLIRDSA